MKWLTLKTVMLCLLTTGKRGQTIHMFTTSGMTQAEGAIAFVINGPEKNTRPGVKRTVIRFKAYADEQFCVVTSMATGDH